EMVNYGASVRLGRGAAIVVEADEYARRFHELAPEVAVVTSIEPDHLDYYRDLTEIEQAFGAFVAKLPPAAWLIACGDDPLVPRRRSPSRRVSYGVQSHAGWHAVDCAPVSDPPGTRFVVVAPDGERAPVALPLVGRHNVANALAALAVAAAEGVPLARA